MAGPDTTPVERDDHFFLAVARWLLRNDVSAIVLSCHRAPSLPLGSRRRPGLEVPGCLRELPLYRMLDLHLAGIRDVAVLPGDCCPDGDGASGIVSLWRSRLGDLMHWSEGDRKPSRNWTWSLSPARVPVDRRGLLGLGRQSEAPWPVHDLAADDQARLVTSLRAAGLPGLEQPPAGASLLASGCTACGVCVAACPHDALTLVLDGSQTTLQHSPDACQGERQCVALCPVDALTVEGPLTWSTVLDGTPHVLATLEMAVCERCQARFPAVAGQQWCEPCRIRRSDPFGSHLPEAAIRLLRARGHDQSS